MKSLTSNDVVNYDDFYTQVTNKNRSFAELANDYYLFVKLQREFNELQNSLIKKANEMKAILNK